MTLTFHQTFTLECENLSKLLTLVSANPSVTNVEIFEMTGIGIGKNERKGKVQPTIEYATYGGLLEPRAESVDKRFELSAVGKLVLEKDRWLKRPVTQWVLHYHLSRPGGEAEAWAFFVHEFLPSWVEFQRSDLESALESKFPSVKVKSINPGVLLNTYIDNNALGRIRLIREAANRTYSRGRPYIPNAYIAAYILAEIWDARHGDRIMVEPSVLSEPGHLSTVMSLDEQDVHYLIDEMTGLGIVDQMRGAPPHQVVRRWEDKLALLRKAYDEE
jgi:Protein of unknown function (DUF4007)